MNAYSNLASSDANIIQSLRNFIHLNSKAPLETVCRSALYLLDRVPASRHAVFEYIGKMYHLFTLLYLQFIQNQKSATGSDQLGDLTDINKALELVENSLLDMLANSNDQWCIEISQWLLSLLGDIVCKTGVEFAESTQSLSREESSMFRSAAIVDGLDIWSNQCKTTQSILGILKICFINAMQRSSSTSNFISFVLKASSTYGAKFDWVLCYLAGLNLEFLLEKIHEFNFKEFLNSHGDTQIKMSRISVLNFYAINYAELTRDSVTDFLASLDGETELSMKGVNFVLKMSAQSPALLNLMLNEILNKQNFNNQLSECLLSQLMLNETPVMIELFNAIKQINNSASVYDLLINLLNWLVSQDLDAVTATNNGFDKLRNLINIFLDDLVSSVYLIKSDLTEESTSLIPLLIAADVIPFLKSLNAINGFSLKYLINQLISIVKNATNSPNSAQIQEIAQKIIILLSINGNESVAKSIQSELFLLPVNTSNQSNAHETFLIKFRQEISPFHESCVRNAIKSLIQSFRGSYHESTNELESFLKNLTLIHEWDLLNQNFMAESLSNILLDSGNFIGLVSELSVRRNGECSFLIASLFNKLFNSSEEDFRVLKLSVDDLLTCSDKLVTYFFELCNSINEENALCVIHNLNETVSLTRNTLNHVTAIESEETNPFRNILLRNLTKHIFESINLSEKNKSTVMNEACEEFVIDEDENLFNSNMNSIDSELTNKSRLKSIRNTLHTHLPFKKQNRNKFNYEMRSIKNFAIIELVEIICSKCDFYEEKLKSLSAASQSSSTGSLKLKRELLSEQLCNLADLLVQKILLEQYCIDYQWPSASIPDVEENFEDELDAIKLFIERDMSVKKMFENDGDDQILWLLLEYIANDEKAFYKVSPLIKSLLGALIVQWESYNDQPTRNIAKTLGTTMRLLNFINRTNILHKPLCFIVDIVPLLSSYESHILLLIIWRNLKKIVYQNLKTTAESNKNLLSANVNVSEIKHMRYIFQKNIAKLAPLYSKFFL